MTAGVLCAASSASAQYHPYAAPAMLPAPQTQLRTAAYGEPQYTPAPAPEMIHHPGSSAVAPGPVAPAPVYDHAMSGPEGCATCDNNGYAYGDDFGLGACGCGPSWYAGFTALYMTRNKPNPYQVSFDTTNPVGELILNTDTIDDDWQEGFEVRVGKYLGCSSAVEFSYWTLDNFGGQVHAYDPAGVGSLNTPFDFRSLNFNGAPVNDLFDNAEAHRLTRNDEFHNFEVNFINLSGNPCSRIRTSGLAGFRYINFRESWQLASSYMNRNFGVDPANEAYYDIDVENNLFGLQIGGRADVMLTDCLSLYAAPRFGVFANYMEHDSRIYSGTGVSAMNVSSNNTILSLLGQLDVGVNYQITNWLSVYGGYRVVAISGIALADQQIPYLQDDLFGISDIDHNSNLVLHGATGGLQICF
jgi:hypothetical protein